MSSDVNKPASLDMALIGFVQDAPRHGYEIYQLLNGTPELRRIWRIKQSRLYAMLARLEDAGLLRSDVVMQEGRPPRKPSGRRKRAPSRSSAGAPSPSPNRGRCAWSSCSSSTSPCVPARKRRVSW